VLSAGCQIWLERLQPVFIGVALLSLIYQIWLVRTRPLTRRKWTIRAVLAASLLLNIIVFGGWIALLIRYG
jgi:hypothetical protein